jgi:hypothetical protein
VEVWKRLKLSMVEHVAQMPEQLQSAHFDLAEKQLGETHWSFSVRVFAISGQGPAYEF